MNNEVRLYTDGSFQCKNGIPSVTYAFLVSKGDSVVYKEGSYLDKNIFARYYKQRNVFGEIMAVLEGVFHCKRKGYHDVTIYHDYQGVACWINGEWRAKNELTQFYVQQFNELSKNNVNIKFVHVKSHTGDKFNEMVDELADSYHQF